MGTLDLPGYLLKQRDDTKSFPVLLTNVVWRTTNTGYPLGAPTVLPPYIKRNKAVVPMDRSPKTRTIRFTDNLCAFRCLAYHRQGSTAGAKILFKQWKAYRGTRGRSWTPKNYPGISLDDMPDFEACFRTDVNVFAMSAGGTVAPLYRSMRTHKDVLSLNAFQNHFSYVKDPRKYSKKYQCENCTMLFRTPFNCLRHYRTCDRVTKFEFPGGFHRSGSDIMDSLARIGVRSDESMFYPYFAVFDFEAMLRPLADGDAKLRWTQRHEAISVAVASNVEGQEGPFCLVEPDLDKLLQWLLDRLTMIQEEAERLALDKWSHVVEQIRSVKEKWGVDDDDEKETTGTESERKASELMKGPVLKADKSFRAYCRKLPVLTYNGSRYDLSLVKSRMARIFHLDQTAEYIVKQANAYTCLTTDRFKFLDVVNFLSPGHSYASFLKSFGVSEKKGYLPYDWISDLDKLEHPNLPPYRAFYSQLKKGNVLEAEHVAWKKGGEKGPAPKTGPEIYADLEELWCRKGMRSFRQYVEHYNTLDVGPFITAVERMLTFYRSKGVDLFKTTVSVPGVARQLLYRASEVRGSIFALPDQRNSDMYRTLKANITGGPSIVFHREHVRGETRIRGNGPLCGSILGYDANALYLWALGQDMPTGAFLRRFESDGFKPKKMDRYMAAYDWMEWVARKEDIHILHKMNSRQEVRIGPYLVDGYCSDTNTVYQYDGCFFHGHLCHVTRNIKNQKWWDEREKEAEETRLRDRFIREVGHDLVVMKECEFLPLKKRDPGLRALIAERQPPFYRKHRGAVSREDILQSVMDGTFYGCVEVDIEVPETWGDVRPYRTEFSPYRYFEEMSPLFCNAKVTFDLIGEHMQNFAREAGLSQKPRRLLVGGMKAEKILLASPLLKWYLDHGMEVSRVYQCVEFVPARCFEQFTREVTECRRMGDRDPDCEVLASTMKLIGNSAYGSLLMDKEKHQDIKYVSGKTKASLMANRNQFKRATDLGEDIFEMEMAKKKISLDLPVQVGYFILQLAKFKMLTFYYDFLDVYVSRKNFQLCQMDTDSLYMAVAGPDLASVIKPEYKSEYEASILGQCRPEEVDASTSWFPRQCCKEHKDWDKRVPGLFKMEYAGSKIVALCSKTYAVKSEESGTSKFSSKGCNKSDIGDAHGLMESVLKTRKDVDVTNRGFRARDNGISTYIQAKKGLCYFYCKRRILADGVSTAPLDMVLTPWDKVD